MSLWLKKNHGSLTIEFIDQVHLNSKNYFKTTNYEWEKGISLKFFLMECILLQMIEMTNKIIFNKEIILNFLEKGV